MKLSLHHVSVPTRSLAQAKKFYVEVLGLREITRPPFSSTGSWLAIGPLQIHLNVHEAANFRDGLGVDNDDIHFAMRVEDFESAVSHMERHGFGEALPNDDPKRIILKRTGLAGFPQMFLMDPDRNIIEINTAPFNTVGS